MNVFELFRSRNVTLPGAGRVLAMGCAALIGVSAAAAQVQVAAKQEGPVAAALSTGDSKAAQEGPIRGPLLGYVFDSSDLRLKPLVGIPGASYVGDPLPLGFTPEFVEVSPNHQYAVGVEASSGNVFVIDLRSSLPSAQPLAQVSTGADRAFLSPQGKAAAFYDRDTAQVEILTGLPAEPNLAGRVNLVSLAGTLTAIGVSDDGKALAIASSEGDRGSLFVATPDEAPQLVGPLGRASALAFLNDVQDLLIADAGRSEVARVRNWKAGAEWTVLASRRDGIDQPVAVIASADSATAFVVQSSGRKIARLPLNGGGIDFVDCPCKPTALDALAPGSVFRLTAASSAPIYMLDARPREGAVSGQPRVLFIPAAYGSPQDDSGASPVPRGRVGR